MNNENIALNDEAKRLLNEVDQSIATDPVTEPGQGTDSEPEKQAATITMEEAESMSAMLVAAAANWAEAYHPALEGRYPESVRKQVAARLAPVVKKYDGALPPWLMKYHEEIMLALCLSGIVYGSVKAMREYKGGQESPGLTG